MFLSCRPFIVITTLSTGLVGVEVTSVSWLGQLTVGVYNNQFIIISDLMEKIKWSEKLTNEQVLDRIGEKKTLQNNILRIKAN